MDKRLITVTSPLLPELDDYIAELKKIWDKKWITNVATTHSIWWNGCKPVFVDIAPATGNLDPNKVEAAITPKTTAIMPVHVYGQPCDTQAIQDIADKYGLRVIYDAAHAFGVEVNGESVLTAGDISTLSFHATKVFNTIEGGAMIMHDEKTKKRIDYLKNFGFANEVTVVGPLELVVK